MAEFGGAVDKAGTGVLDSLEFAVGCIRQAIKKTVTVVEPASNKGVNEDFSVLTADFL